MSETTNGIPRVGIDFGNTIGMIENEQPFPHAYEMITHLIHKFGPENVFVISKAGPEMECNIRAWLKQTQFSQVTGFDSESNLFFVRAYKDKASIVKEKRISIFFDDKFKVVSSLAKMDHVERIFWMFADTRELQLIPKHLRHKIAITKRWGSTTKYFSRIPKQVLFSSSPLAPV